ncbi:MAG: hypothetical protein FWE57_08330, partial [Chitinispirillia bacterium]|nr:hypothetical protein [Chitinispirillia bacterium]
GFQQFCLYGGAAFAVIGLIALISGGVFWGLLFGGLGIGWVINHFSKKKAIKARTEAINTEYDSKLSKGIEIIKSTIAEIVDILNEFSTKDSDSAKVMDFIDQIKPGEVLQELKEDSALSAALPIWNIEPPVVAVRRKAAVVV